MPKLTMARSRVAASDLLLERSCRQCISVLAIAAFLGGCASAIKPVALVDVKYLPGKTSSAELVRQAGLPNLVKPVTIAGVPYRKFVYLKGSESTLAFIPVPVPLGTTTAIGGVLMTTFQTASDSALECLVSAEDVVVECKAGGRE